MPYTLASIRDQWACHLKQSSITFTSQGAILHVTRTKTIQFRQRVLEILLPSIPGSPLCPVTALQQYLATIPRNPPLPLFVNEARGIYQPVLAHQYNAFIKAAIAAIGLHSKSYSSHSFRRGGATFAFASHAPTAFIKAQGDWQSDAYLVYLQLSKERQTQNPQLYYHQTLPSILTSPIYIPFGFGISGLLRAAVVGS